MGLLNLFILLVINFVYFSVQHENENIFLYCINSSINRLDCQNTDTKKIIDCLIMELKPYELEFDNNNIKFDINPFCKFGLFEDDEFGNKINDTKNEKNNQNLNQAFLFTIISGIFLFLTACYGNTNKICIFSFLVLMINIILIFDK